MKILVLGGSRHFGRRLVSLLLEQGHDVSVMNRGSRTATMDSRAKFVFADRSDEHSLRNAVASQSWDLVYDQVCYKAAEARLAVRLLSERTERYILTSTLSVYSERPNKRESDFDPYQYKVTPDLEMAPDYGEGKRQCESILAKGFSDRIAMVRIPMVFGPDDYSGRIEFHIDHCRSGKPVYFPSLSAQLSLVSSADAAAFLFLASQKKIVGPVNVASADPIVLSDFVRLVEEASSKKMNIVSQPKLGEASPLGVERDWTLNVERCAGYGFVAQPVKEWLPPLINSLAANR